jgi:hypothetical protein
MHALVMTTVLVVGDGGGMGRIDRPDAGEVRLFDLKGDWEGTAYTGGGRTYSVKFGNGRRVFTGPDGSLAEVTCTVEADDQNVK